MFNLHVANICGTTFIIQVIKTIYRQWTHKDQQKEKNAGVPQPCWDTVWTSSSIVAVEVKAEVGALD